MNKKIINFIKSYIIACITLLLVGFLCVLLEIYKPYSLYLTFIIVATCLAIMIYESFWGK